MVIKGTGLTNKTINYDIRKNLWWWPWPSTINSEDSNGSVPYEINESGTYYFKATVEGFQKTSEPLDVAGGDLPLEDNSLPVAIITAPQLNDLNFLSRKNIDFNQSSYDKDDLLKITWDFGDGTTQTITNYANYPNFAGNTTANVVHNYSSPGRYLVTLTAEETKRGQKDDSEEKRYVKVFSEGINVFPVISSPKEGEASGTKIINFNANTSYVLKCSSAACPTVPCIAVEGLNCYYLHSSSSTAPVNYDLFLKWTVIEGTNIIQLASGNWFNEDGTRNLEVISFYHNFFWPKSRMVKLYMEYIAK
jgi:hypothetical protein